MFVKNLQGIELDKEIDLDNMAKQTEGYSGSDLMGVIKEIKMEFIRRCVA